MNMSGNRRPSHCSNRTQPEHRSPPFPLYQYAEDIHKLPCLSMKVPIRSIWNNFTMPSVISLCIQCLQVWLTDASVVNFVFFLSVYGSLISVQTKVKANPLQAWTGPEVSRRFRFPDFKTIDTWRWKGCQLCTLAAFTPRKYSWYSFLLEAESTPGP